MIFLGKHFLSSPKSLKYTPTDVSDIKKITLKNAIFDSLFVTRNTSIPYSDDAPTEWTYDTIMSALFKGNLHAGNVDYTEDQVSEIRIKRRKKGSYDWITLFQIPITSKDDFTFERFDRYACSNTEYEYALIPVMDNVEGNISLNSVTSEFNGLCVADKEKMYTTLLNINLSVQRNQSAIAIPTIGSRYPHFLTNGNSSYDIITVSAGMVKTDYKTCDFDFDSGNEYRQGFMDFMTNGKPKIIKYEDGRMWLIGVTDALSETADSSKKIPTTTFSCVEIGDCESGMTLYHKNLIDANVNGR